MDTSQTNSVNKVSESLKDIPHGPGVYLYRDFAGSVIYVGKAVDLAKRVRQYFARDDAVGLKTRHLVSRISDIETITTANEFDALLLEANLIREYMPRYNVIAKDDKSPLYVAISIGEELPRIYFSRKPKLTAKENGSKTTIASLLKNETQFNNAAIKQNGKVIYFGPFQSSKVTRQLMRTLRRIVPYCTQKQRNGKPCFYTHLGLCNPCPSAIAGLPQGDKRKVMVREYRKHMFRIRDILTGKATDVLEELRREMEMRSKAEDFENAAKIRNQIEVLTTLLTRRYDPVLYTQNDLKLASAVDEEILQLINVLSRYYPNLDSLNRIECFDISNLTGLQATGSMVVLTRGLIDTSEYRRFKIRRTAGPNDTAMMREVLTRRFTRDDWPVPDLIIVDGGKGQVTSARVVMKETGKEYPVIGLAKREEEIIVPFHEGYEVIRLPFTSGALHLLQRIRDEAHRFAITYHRKLRGKAFLE